MELQWNFVLSDIREIRYYGKTKDSNESLLRTEKFNENEVFYQTKFGWGVFVNTDTMETVSYDGTEWGGQKIKRLNMKKCKCVKESKWFIIDDSFDENSQIKGGPYTFNVDEEYDFFTEDSFYGICYTVIHDDKKTYFYELKFNNHFKIINS